MKAYKKNSKGSPEAEKLYHHKPVVIQGQEFTCWREYATFKMAEHIREVLPDAGIEVTLDGENSTIQIEIDDEEQKKLNREMYNFLKEYK